MKKLKQVFAFSLAAVMSFSLLTGCGTGSATSNPTGAEITTAGGAETSTVPSGEKTVITIWTKDRHDADFMQQKVDKYNAINTHNIEIKYEIYSDNYVQAVDMVFQSGEAPDMFVYQEQIFANYVHAGKYADITPLMDDEFKSVFANSFINGVSVIDGKTYFIPTGAVTCRLFYNVEIFERVGLDGPPETLEQMVEYSKKITAALSGEGIYGFASNMKGAQSALARSFDQAVQRSLGINKGFDFAKGEYDFTGYTKIVEIWRDLLSADSAFPGCESLDIDPLRTQFAAGKIGMYMSYTSAEPGVYANQFPMEEEKWACAEIPALSGVVNGAQDYTVNNGYLFNSDSPNLEAAWTVYTELFANTDNLAEYYSAGLGISLVPDAIAKAEPAQCYLNNPALLIGDTDSIYPKPPHTANTDAVIIEGQNYYDSLAELIWNGGDIEKGLQDITDRYNKAYQTGIQQGIGQDLKIENFDPMHPAQ